MTGLPALMAIQWEENMARLQAMLADQPDQLTKWKEEIKRRSLQTGMSPQAAGESVLRDVSRGETL